MIDRALQRFFKATVAPSWEIVIWCPSLEKKKAFHLSVNVFSTKLLFGDTIFSRIALKQNATETEIILILA